MFSLAKNRQLIVGGLVGNVMEFFDFIVYVYLSKYLMANFFPHEDPFVSKLLMFSVFASGYLTRPFGAMLFGHVGDKYGRKIALIQSIVLITIATACMGLLPTYAEIGLVSSLLLMLCRLVQGFAVSGEQSGVAVYLSESMGVGKHGFIGALVLGSSYFGVLLGLLTCLGVSSFLPEQEMFHFGWRIPFLLSILLGLVSLVLRVSGAESIEFKKIKTENKISRTPVKDAFKNQWVDIVLMILLVMGLSVPIYMYTIYIPNYISEIANFGTQKGLIFSSVSLAFISILVPTIGRVADRIGNEKLLLIALSFSCIFGYPVFLMLSWGTNLSVVCGLLVLGVIVSSIAAPIFGVLLKVFPTQFRYTSVSFVFNTSMSLFGSTVPIVSISLIQYFGDRTFPGIYVALSGLVGAMALYFSYYRNLAVRSPGKHSPLLRSIGV
jgi:MFS transporter, MHS family, proline/betaine transporter